MKRLPILSKVLFLLVCFSAAAFAYNAGSTINSELILPYVESAPLNDGVEDASWIFPDVGVFAVIDGNPPESAEDLSGWFKLTWNEDGLYLFVHVVDDTIVWHANSWQADCIEIFIDGQNEKASALDANDVQWRYVVGEDTMALCYTSVGNLRPAEYYMAMDTTSDGYTFELEVPNAGLDQLGTSLGIPMVPGTKIGFDLQITDNDSSTGNDEAFRWHATGGGDYAIPANWGTVIFGGVVTELQIPNVTLAPFIDGDLDVEWTDASVPEVAMSAIAGGVANTPDSLAPDCSSFFRAAWNASGFYLFGRVVDDSIYAGSANSYENDGWEIYFDGDNSKSTSYDADDVQWRWVYGQSAGEAQNGPDPVNSTCAWVATADGYTFEVAIPLADLPFTPAMNHVIGFEVQVNENDGSGRDGITKWWSNDNNTWQDPSLLGTAVLSDTLSSKVPEEVAANVNLSAPAILTSNANISYTLVNKGTANLSLYNILGQEVACLVNGEQDAGTYTVKAPDLASGVYFVILKTANGSSTAKVTALK